jgi:tripartite ATP-independent transporter DctM subunit
MIKSEKAELKEQEAASGTKKTSFDAPKILAYVTLGFLGLVAFGFGGPQYTYIYSALGFILAVGVLTLIPHSLAKDETKALLYYSIPLIVFALFTSFSRFHSVTSFGGLSNGLINLFGICAFFGLGFLSQKTGYVSLRGLLFAALLGFSLFALINCIISLAEYGPFYVQRYAGAVYYYDGTGHTISSEYSILFSFKIVAGSLATGALAAGGTLGIMIPPSVPLVIYAILTQESIGKLFMAAVLPGVIAMIGYMLVIKIIVTLNPSAGPAGPRASWAKRMKALAQVAPVLLVFVVVIVGIYGGWANPTEAAAIGAAACGVLAVVSGGMRTKGLIDSALGTAQATAMIFLVLLGADMLNTALALSQMPVELAAWVQASQLSPMVVMVAILLIYIFLGCVMDSLAMILLTIPIFYPVIMGLDFYGMTDTDKSVWFGILALMVVEIGLVHPPVGMNVFIINRLARDVPLVETFKGVMPFLASDFIRIALLLIFPSISLVLVRTFGG